MMTEETPPAPTSNRTFVAISLSVLLFGGLLAGLAYHRLHSMALDEMRYDSEQKVKDTIEAFRTTLKQHFFTLNELAKLSELRTLSSHTKQQIWPAISAPQPWQDSPHTTKHLQHILEIKYATKPGPNGAQRVHCYIRKAYHNSQPSGFNHRLMSTKIDICAAPATFAELKHVQSRQLPRLAQLRALALPDRVTQYMGTDALAIIYPLLSEDGTFTGWLIATLDAAGILAAPKHSFGNHAQVFYPQGDRFVPLDASIKHPQPPMPFARPASQAVRQIHFDVPDHAHIVHQRPNEMHVIRNQRYVIETQFYLSGMRLLLTLERPYDLRLYHYPSFIGAAIFVLFAIMASIIGTQLRVRSHAEAMAQTIARKLYDKEDRLKAAAEGSQDGIWDWNIREDTVWFSKRYYEILGYEDNEFEASADSFFARIHPDDLDTVKDALKAHVKTQAIYSPTFRMQHKNGHYIWIHSRGQASFINGVAVRMAGVHTDITEEKKRQLELADAREKAESATEVKAMFLANMSHEIRTPLNGIIGISELLARTALNAKQTQFVATLRDSCETLMQIVNDILDYSKLEAKKMPIENIAFSLKDATESTIALYMPEVRKKPHVALLYEYDDNLPHHYKGDPTRIRQILMNLISNAIKFTENGHVKLTVTGTASEENEILYNITLTVEDTGIGMPPELRNHIFTKFTQADHSITRKYGGTGLGLSIINELILLLDGHIDIESAPGKGTRFSVTIPLKRSSTYPEETLIAPVSVSDKPKKPVLVVEDNATNQQIMAWLLEDMGVAFHIASNGKEAIELLNGSHDFGLILMDCHMPVMDGMSATRAIRARDDACAQIPIVALSANNQPSDQELCLACGMDAFLSKPVSREKLLDTIQRYVAIDRQKTESPPRMKPKEVAPETILNSEKLLNLTNSSVEVTNKLAHMFEKTVLESIEHIEASLEANDSEKLRYHAHTLKGAAANMYAEKMRFIAYEIESLHDTPEMHAEIPPKIQSLKRAHAEVRSAITLLLDSLGAD
jgi:PAS domain S-box-containing protein